MKRASEIETEASKRQKFEEEFRIANTKAFEKHINEHNFALGYLYNSGKTLYIQTYFSIEVNVENGVISGRKYILTPNSLFETWLFYSVNLNSHWHTNNEKAVQDVLRLNSEAMEHYVGVLYTNLSHIPKIGNFWYLKDTQLIYCTTTSHRPENATLLRDLKLDRILPLQELLIYLTVTFDLSSVVLESLFWCGYYSHKVFVQGFGWYENPAKRLVWNCFELSKKALK
jgi:hypothetical protein